MTAEIKVSTRKPDFIHFLPGDDFLIALTSCLDLPDEDFLDDLAGISNYFLFAQEQLVMMLEAGEVMKVMSYLDLTRKLRQRLTALTHSPQLKAENSV